MTVLKASVQDDGFKAQWMTVSKGRLNEESYLPVIALFITSFRFTLPPFRFDSSAASIKA